jgi:hypothetical protein
MEVDSLALWALVATFFVLINSQSLARPSFFAASSCIVQEEDDDDTIYLIAAAEACAGADPEAFPLERDSHGVYYIKPRSIAWWDSFEADEIDEQRWHKLLRVSRGTFYYLVEQLTPALKTNVPFSFSQIPNRVLTVKRQVAMSLNRLATGHSAFAISELFGVSEATVSLTTRKFCRAVWRTLRPQHLSWPSTHEEMQAVIQGFKQKRGLPNCCGAIDCSHFVLELPNNAGATCWFDRDHNYSMKMQAVVDANGRFLNINVGWPESVNDTRVLRNSELYQKVLEGDWLAGPSELVGGVEVPQYIVEDAGFPGVAWLVVPYPGDHLPDIRDRFNFFHSSTRIIVDCAFGRLKGIWRILLRRIYKPDLTSCPL